MNHENHDERRDPDCVECQSEFVAAYHEHIGSWRAERQQRESVVIARVDLDMPWASERDVSTAILLRLK